jgi:hypothetical protein
VVDGDATEIMMADPLFVMLLSFGDDSEKLLRLRYGTLALTPRTHR